MEGVSKELRLKFQEILNDESLEEHEKVKKIYANRSFLSLEQVAGIFGRSITWMNLKIKYKEDE